LVAVVLRNRGSAIGSKRCRSLLVAARTVGAVDHRGILDPVALEVWAQQFIDSRHARQHGGESLVRTT